LIKKKIFYIALVYTIVIVGIYLPQRWKSDFEALKFSLSDGNGYVFLKDKNALESIEENSYVIVDNPDAFQPYNLAYYLDKTLSYLGYVEFRKNDERVLEAEKTRKYKDLFFRVHMLKEKEYEKLHLDNFSTYLRFRRAVIERSIDLLVLKNIPSDAKEYVKNRLEKELGWLITSRPQPHSELKLPLMLPFVSLTLFTAALSPILGILSFILYFFSKNIAVSVASILAMISLYKYIKKNPFILFLSFLLLGIVTSLSLSDFNHLNQIEVYRGVKISLILLPLLVLIKGVLNNEWIFKERKVFWSLLGIFAVVIVYYILRSGNNGFVLGIERKIRDYLDYMLIVRPRFKELFGYIFLFLFFKRESRWSFVYEFFGSIALSSTFNTFTHIKAPIFVSIYRSFLGFLIALFVYKVVYVMALKKKENKGTLLFMFLMLLHLFSFSP